MGWLMGNKSWKQIKQEVKNPLPVKTAAALPDERTVSTFVVSRNWGGIPTVGGVGSVTSSGFLFEPIDTDQPRKILKLAGAVTGDPILKAASRATDALAKTGHLDPVRFAGSEIQTVKPIGRTGIQMTMTDGSSHDFGVSKSTWTPRWSGHNQAARDHALAQITHRLGTNPPQ